MPDVFDRKTRSRIMSSIRSKNTKIELILKAALTKRRLRFRYQPSEIDGHPDFLIEERVAVFCDSSFWHGRNWIKLRKQLRKAVNHKYWVNHISKNRSRDLLVNAHLRSQGYKVVRLWDREIVENLDRCLTKVIFAKKSASDLNKRKN